MTDKHFVSVVVPTLPERKPFFDNFVYPALEAAGAGEILTDWGETHPNVKRNRGAARAQYPHVFFCDDDVIVSANIFDRLLSKIHGGDYSYAYCNSRGFTLPGAMHYFAGAYNLCQQAWSEEDVRYRGTVTPMTLFDRDDFLRANGFSEGLENGHMRDLAIRLLGKGLKGIHCPEYLFLQFNLDDGITGRAAERNGGGR